MVYCTKCGTENEEEAEVCTSCGTSLRVPSKRYLRNNSDWDWEWDGRWGRRHSNTWPLIFGGFLVMLGLSQLLEDVFWWFSFDTLWPVFLIGIGLVYLIAKWAQAVALATPC